jgi:dihydropteroate synthase
MVKLVGILNVTPDSFSDGGKYFDAKDAIKRAEQMFNEGASLVDIGAESTRPNATVLTATEEWDRLKDILPSLLERFPGLISLDSHNPETIRKAFSIGPVIINDVTGLNNPQMMDLVIELGATVIISHLPEMTIQKAHELVPITDPEQVKEDLLARATQLRERGLPEYKIILDPGIGFGKTNDVNKQLLKFASKVPEYKVMIGYSRKRFLGDDRMSLEPNLRAGLIAVKNGADYLRVHDVSGHSKLLNFNLDA